ncbi:hypothetical protein HGRIS_004125 [Hohenbuehelia grisea]|uniref:Uncharacterized protein n=1 Tax=Hohenbuehelia grisea TaxID=104357 RepID=A0ABR3JIQ9_9AGAR
MEELPSFIANFLPAITSLDIQHPCPTTVDALLRLAGPLVHLKTLRLPGGRRMEKTPELLSETPRGLFPHLKSLITDSCAPSIATFFASIEPPPPIERLGLRATQSITRLVARLPRTLHNLQIFDASLPWVADDQDDSPDEALFQLDNLRYLFIHFKPFLHGNTIPLSTFFASLQPNCIEHIKICIVIQSVGKLEDVDWLKVDSILQDARFSSLKFFAIVVCLRYRWPESDSVCVIRITDRMPRCMERNILKVTIRGIPEPGSRGIEILRKY